MKEWLIDTGGDLPGNVFLIRGEKNFIFDTDMAYCSGRLADNLERELEGKKLDAVFLTHSHYDHISGLPELRKRWPSLIVYAAPYAAKVMKKESARRMIRSMNEAAAAVYCGAEEEARLDYDDHALFADQEISDGQQVRMGEYTITAYETPGHTRDCLSYLIEKEGESERLLLCSETTGAMAQDQTMIPVALVSFKDSLKAIDKLEQLKPDGILLSHYGYVEVKEDTFLRMREEFSAAKERYLTELRSGRTEEEMIENLKQYYWTEAQREYQPYRAYAENTKYMLRTIKREFLEEGD